MNNARTISTVKNVLFSYIGKLSTTLLSLISRTIIIKYLGVAVLGINGLFSNILGILALSDMGIHLAIQFSMYKPVASNDYQKVKALMLFYKKIYRYIMAFILFAGLALLPFVGKLVERTGELPLNEVYLYYGVFLFNTVISYLATYATSVIYAEQKAYQITNIETVTNIISTTIQIIVLLISKNYLVFLITHSIVVLLSKIYLINFVNKTHPALKGLDATQLTEEETKGITKQLKALFVHKIGEVSVTQTDNIIITYFDGISTIGYVSNYLTIINLISDVLAVSISACIPGVGNVIASESIEKIRKIFYSYNFLCRWMYFVSSICLITCLNTLIKLWLGAEYRIGESLMLVLCVNYYMCGMRSCINNTKSAGGMFYQDRYLSLIQGSVNLISSIILANYLGVLGVYVGTVISGLLPSIVRPIIVYKYILKENSKTYFVTYCRDLIVAMLFSILTKKCVESVLVINSWMGLILMASAIFVISNLLFVILNFKDKSFSSVIGYLGMLIKRVKC